MFFCEACIANTDYVIPANDKHNNLLEVSAVVLLNFKRIKTTFNIKMRLITFLVILCLYLYQCDAAPPKEVADKIPCRNIRFTDEEDNLIIEELSHLCVDSKVKLFSKHILEHVAEKIKEKFDQGTPGFPQVRTENSLQAHFRLILKNNNQTLKNKLPENLLKLIRQDLNESAQEYNPPYTPEENQLIIEELSKSSCTQPFSSSSCEAIRQIHATKWQDQTPGFENERTATSIRSHIDKLKREKKLPHEVLKKLRTYNKGASSSKST